MTVTLTDREKEVLNSWLHAWDEDHLLPGNLSYRDVLKLVDKLQLDPPRNLISYLNHFDG